MLDIKLFYLANHSCSNPVFDLLMPVITILGDGKFILALAILLILITRKPRKLAGVLLLAGLGVSRFVVHFLKDFFARPRPFVTLENVSLLVTGLDKGHSFPSGHAVVAFMAAVILASYFSSGYIFFLIAIAVCFSRVYIGVHYVSDVIAGAILGSLIGYALVYAAKKLRRE